MYVQLYVLIYLTMCIIKVHSITVNMTASPKYILKDVVITMTCEITESTNNGTATFYTNSNVILASVTYDEGGCTSSTTSYNCILETNKISFMYMYTPSSTPLSSQSFHCRYDGDGNSYTSDSIVIRSAVFPSAAVLSPDTTSYDIVKGQTLNTITCQASTCWPVCTFRWTGPNFSMAGSTLIITNIDKSNSGQYMCKATNVIGTTSSSMVTVSVKYGPDSVSISPSDTSYTREQGNTLDSITCSADCRPACSYQWIYPNGQRYNSANLTIDSLQKQDHGTFTCKAQNGIGQGTTTSIHVTVNYGPESVSISPSDTSYTREQGNTLDSITCSADCRPACSYQWIYPNGQRYNSAHLTIDSLQKQDHGTFTCKAQNGIGQGTTTSIHVTVNYKPEDIQLQPNHTSYAINESTTSPSISCSAQCRPGCGYRWTGPNYSSINERLQFTNINRVKKGRYTCMAENSYGQISSSAVDLIVHTLPSKVSALTLKCTGATTAVITWLPDFSVVPTAHFTLQYKTKESGTFTNMSFLDSTAQKLIYVMHVDNLNPSSEYVFAITSANYLGYKRSNEVNCTTSDKDVESSLSGIVIGGIVMLTIATLLIAIVIICVVLQRYRKMKDDTTGVCGFTNSLSTLSARLTRKKPTLNEENDYVNVDKEGTKTTAVGTNDTATTDGPTEIYDDLERGKSKKHAYEAFEVSETANTTPVDNHIYENRQSGHYVNTSVIKQNMNPKAPTKLPKKKRKPKKASTPTKDAVYMQVL